jgi:hypothetical protein
MKRILIALIATGVCLAAWHPAAAATLCPSRPEPPLVNVHFVESPIDFKAEQDRAALEALSAASGAERGLVEEAAMVESGHVRGDGAPYHTFVGGLMQAEIALWHDVSFGHATDAATGKSCLWIEQVDVRLTLDPQVYVASDLQQHDCWYQELYRHELKHVGIDRDMLQRYSGRMTDGLGLVFSGTADYVSGPIDEDDAAAIRTRMRDAIALPLGVMFERLMAQRNETQRALDNPAEYARIAHICAGEPHPPFRLSQAAAE